MPDADAAALRCLIALGIPSGSVSAMLLPQPSRFRVRCEALLRLRAVCTILQSCLCARLPKLLAARAGTPLSTPLVASGLGPRYTRWLSAPQLMLVNPVLVAAKTGLAGSWWPGAAAGRSTPLLGALPRRAMFSERKTNRPICYPAGWLIPEKSAEFSESIC